MYFLEQAALECRIKITLALKNYKELREFGLSPDTVTVIDPIKSTNSRPDHLGGVAFYMAEFTDHKVAIEDAGQGTFNVFITQPGKTLRTGGPFSEARLPGEVARLINSIYQEYRDAERLNQRHGVKPQS